MEKLYHRCVCGVLTASQTHENGKADKLVDEGIKSLKSADILRELNGHNVSDEKGGD